MPKIGKAPKAASLEGLLEDISRSSLATPRSVAFEKQLCVTCGKDASTFKDDICRKEYSLSGMCQVCQDGFFVPFEPEGDE